MSPIEARFAGLKAKGEKALVLFATAGDPALDQLPEILLALQAGGADLIEVGIPFSDPIADGPTIQASSQRALGYTETSSGNAGDRSPRSPGRPDGLPEPDPADRP